MERTCREMFTPRKRAFIASRVLFVERSCSAIDGARKPRFIPRWVVSRWFLHQPVPRDNRILKRGEYKGIGGRGRVLQTVLIVVRLTDTRTRPSSNDWSESRVYAEVASSPSVPVRSRRRTGGRVYLETEKHLWSRRSQLLPSVRPRRCSPDRRTNPVHSNKTFD